jgi:hypothetical protein
MPTNVESQQTDIIIPTEKDTIELYKKRVKEIQQGRASYEKQWLVNVAFLYGKQYFTVEKKPMSGLDERIVWELKSLERKKKTRCVANYILPLYRSLLARLLMMKANINVEPLTRSPRDVDTAKVAQEVLEDFWLEVNKTNAVLSQDYASMLGVLAKLFAFILATGQAWLKPYFNPKAMANVVFDDGMGGKTINEFEVGAVETEVIHAFEAYPDPMKRWFIQKKILPVEQIEDLYGVEVKKEEIGQTEVEKQLVTLLEQGTDTKEKYENAAEVYEMYELPSKNYPQGRFVLGTGSKLIIDSGLPEEYKSKLPVFKFNYLDLMLNPYPQGMVEQIIGLQEEYNFTVSRLKEYKKWFAGKLKVPKNCKLESKYDDEVGQIIRYDSSFGEPHFETPPPPPAFLMEEVERIRRDMEDVSSVHDSSLGRVPEQAKSGIAIENLTSLDNSQLMPVLTHIEQQLGFFCEMVLDIVEKRYTEERLLNITGDTLAAQIKTFRGEQVTGNHRIKISLGSGMPQSKEMRQQLIMTLVKEQYITREKGLELLEFGDLEGLYVNVDETAQKGELQSMIDGQQVMVNDWDNHTAHLKVLDDFLKSEQQKKTDPQVLQMILLHRQEHQQGLTGEMQTAARMSAPPVPPMQPQGAPNAQ